MSAGPPAVPHPGPLVGMRVLELAQIMAGPTCGALLADLGADVIKVEKLPGGDDARGYREPRVNGVSAPYLILNRNKRGIALDLKRREGREILLRLVRHADVLVENFRRGTMEKLDLSYETLAAENPALIYCAITGFGRDGPFADKGGFDLIAQGFAGLMSITGERGRPPVKTGNPVSDINAGILASVGILAAYAHRLKTGRGQIVDTSLMEAALQQTYWHAASYFATGESPGPLGSAHILTAPYQAFAASDGWLNIGGANQANWERIADVLGHPEWRDDPRFATNTARMENLPALVAAMNGVLAQKSRAEWLTLLDAAGVPAGPVNSLGEALTHPQTLARGMVVDLVHPQAGPTKALGCPIHLSATPPRVDRPAPLLGEHDDVADVGACDYLENVRSLCPHGDVDANKTMVVLGDSHARAWIPAFDVIGEKAGWTTYYLVRPQCTAARVSTALIPGGREDTDCEAFHDWALTAIKKLEPELVVVSTAPAMNGVYVDGERTVDPKEVATEMTKGYADLFAKLAPLSKKTILIRDVPRSMEDTGECLGRRRNDLGDCILKRDDRSTSMADVSVASAQKAGVPVIDSTPWFCWNDVCPPVIGSTIPLRDLQHITVSYSRQLAEPLGKALGLWPADATTAP